VVTEVTGISTRDLEASVIVSEESDKPCRKPRYIFFPTSSYTLTKVLFCAPAAVMIKRNRMVDMIIFIKKVLITAPAVAGTVQV
jgi:hypothetical protein